MQVAANLTKQNLFILLVNTTVNTISKKSNYSPSSNQHRFTSPNRSDPTIHNLSLTEQDHHVHINHSALGIFLSLFCFITVFGNGLVIYAIVQERYLKSGKKPTAPHRTECLQHVRPRTRVEQQLNYASIERFCLVHVSAAERNES